MKEVPFSAYRRDSAAASSGGTLAGAAAAPGHRDEAFVAREWFRLLAETCVDPPARAVVHRLEAEGRGAALDLPVVSRPIRRFGLTGREVRGLATFYSGGYRPPGLDAHGDPGPAVGLWSGRLQALDPRVDHVVFRALAERDGLGASLARGLRAAGFRVEVFPDFGNWYQPVAGGRFEAYWSARPGRLRSTVRRKGRALERDGTVEFLRLDRPGEAEAAVRAYAEVEARAWQPPEPHPAFVPELIRRGLLGGWVRLWLLKLDGRPIAAQIWTLQGGGATIAKLVYDGDWKGRSPGSLLTHAALRDAMEEGQLAEIDFGRGDDSYKQQWMDGRRQRWGLAAYNARTLPGTLLALRNLGMHRLRALARRSGRPPEDPFRA